MLAKKPSASKMWFVHWLLGIAFYVTVGIAVWIEGAGMPAIEVVSPPSKNLNH